MAGAAFEKVRALIERFARQHEECCRATSAGPKGPHRCAVCGLLLLFGDVCPEHRASQRLPWQVELSKAFAEELEARARGWRVLIPAGHAGDVMFMAQRYASRAGWDWLEKVR